MSLENLRGPGLHKLAARQSELLDLQLARFQEQKPPYWPLVKREQISRVWSEFSSRGRVGDEKGLQQILCDMRDCCAILNIATNVAEHGPLSTKDYLHEQIADGKIDPNKLEAFVNWLIEDESGFWRISDFGLPKVELAICLALESQDTGKIIKFLDRALNVVHQRGDLSRLFVEGGRQTVVDISPQKIDQDDELVIGSLIRDADGDFFRVHYMRRGLIVAHPIINGKPAVSADTTVRFWVHSDKSVASSSENDRTDPVYFVAQNAYEHLSRIEGDVEHEHEEPSPK